MAGKNRGRHPGKDQAVAEVESPAVELEPCVLPEPEPFDLEILEAPGTPALAVPAGLMDRAMDYAGQAAAPNTIRAYRSDWRAFEEWTLANGLAALPVEPSTLALYATNLAEAGKRCSTPCPPP